MILAHASADTADSQHTNNMDSQHTNNIDSSQAVAYPIHEQILSLVLHQTASVLSRRGHNLQDVARSTREQFLHGGVHSDEGTRAAYSSTVA